MKKYTKFFGTQSMLFCVFALVTVIGFSLTSCGNGGGGGDDRQIYAMDVSANSDWNYMVFDDSGAGFLYRADNNDHPTRMFIRPDKDADDGYTYIFNDKGLPEKIIHNDYIFIFSNYSGYKVDIILMKPDGSTVPYLDTQTEINFDEFINSHRSISGSDRSLTDWDWLGFASTAIDIGTCLVAPWCPPAWIGCGTFLATEAAGLAIDFFLDGNSEADAHIILDTFGCVTGGGGNILDIIGTANDCLSSYNRIVDRLTGSDDDLLDLREDELRLVEATFNYGRGDVKVTLTWDNYADVDLHVVDPSGTRIYWNHDYSSATNGQLDVDDTNGFGPENIYWPKDGAPDGNYRVYVKHYSGSSPSNFLVQIIAFGNVAFYRGYVTSASANNIKYLAEFNRSGITSKEVYVSDYSGRSAAAPDFIPDEVKP